MTERLFDLAFYLAAPFWALMIVAPAWSWTRRIASSPLIVVPPLVVYVVVMAPRFGDFWTAVSVPDLGVWAALAGTTGGAAATWAHLIGFDLFVGRWMYLDSRDRGIHPLVMAPLLVLTILLSPLGLVAYLVVRYAAAAARPLSRPRESAAR